MNETVKKTLAAPDNDNRAAPPPPPGSGGLMADFIMAVRFYSILPTGPMPHQAPDINRIARAAPFASLIIGMVPAAVLALGWFLHLNALFTALSCVAASAVVTGAMAEDAIGDSMDGLGGRTRERRLEILKDSRIGAYGVLGIVFFVGLKSAALMQLLEVQGAAAALLYLAAGVIARSAALYLPYALPAARKTGAAASVGALKRLPMLVGFGFAALISALLAMPLVGFAGMACAFFLILLFCAFWTSLWRDLIGGQTGDLIGGLQAVLEILSLTAFILLAGGPH